MSSDIGRRTPRPAPPPRSSGGGVAIFITAVALVLGFLILSKVNDSGSTGGGGGGGGGTPTSLDDTDTSNDASGLTTQPPTTLPAQTKTGTAVQVANCSIQNGVAKAMTASLADNGFTTVDAVTGTCEPKLSISMVIYNASDPAGQPVAETLAAVLGDLPVNAASLPILTQSGSWAQGSAVVLLLGNDLAGKTIDEISGIPTTGTTVAPVVQG